MYSMVLFQLTLPFHYGYDTYRNDEGWSVNCEHVGCVYVRIISSPLLPTMQLIIQWQTHPMKNPIEL